MALMTPQPISTVITPTFAAPTASDTIKADSGLLLYVKNGATSSTVTIVVPSYVLYVGTITQDLVATFSNSERAFYIPPSIADPATGLVTVTYSSTATVTAALLKV
jgi:hypothetical protein